MSSSLWCSCGFENKLFSLSATEYLNQFEISVYLNDVVKQLLNVRYTNPIDFMAEYFAAVVNGSHVINREFEFIRQTSYNRCAFAIMLRKMFHNIKSVNENDCGEYVQLVLLACSDFPVDMVRQIFTAVSKQWQINITNFLSAFQVHFIFFEFFQRIQNVFNDNNSVALRDILNDHSLTGVQPSLRSCENGNRLTAINLIPHDILSDVVHNECMSDDERSADNSNRLSCHIFLVNALREQRHVTFEQLAVVLYRSQYVQQYLTKQFPTLCHETPKSLAAIVRPTFNNEIPPFRTGDIAGLSLVSSEASKM
jgi:hypothetical protein